tara:strand:+ start:1091 stop:1597 length:507 start_codon:yes stop_codon:yes gene_type:complete
MQYKILDPCCATRAMWFNKNDDRCLFADQRQGRMVVRHHRPKSDKGAIRNRNDKVVDPVYVHDFRQMPYPDNSFYHVVFDPPHIRNISMKSQIGFAYGSLDKETWQEDIKKGFAECFRVLKPNGTLIFKWNEVDIPLRRILKLTDYTAMYGHRTGKKMLTHWVAFIKD